MLSRKLDSNWDMTFGQGLGNYLVDRDAVMQNVKTRLQHLRGEWFLDVDAGVPYLQEICIKPANQELADAIIKETIIDTDGIKTLESYSSSFDADTRTLFITASVSTIFGTTDNIRLVL